MIYRCFHVYQAEKFCERSPEMSRAVGIEDILTWTKWINPSHECIFYLAAFEPKYSEC